MRKIIRPTIYAVIAILLTIDFLRVSIGASSFVALTHLEITAGLELVLIFILLVRAYLKLRIAQTKGMLLIMFFAVWFVMFGIIIEFANKSEKEIAGHWDKEILHLINDGHSDNIKQVNWNRNVPDVRKQCVVAKKEQRSVFPNKFKYEIKCSQPETRLIAILSIDTIEGSAGAYVELGP